MEREHWAWEEIKHWGKEEKGRKEGSEGEGKEINVRITIKR